MAQYEIVEKSKSVYEYYQQQEKWNNIYSAGKREWEKTKA